MKGFDYLYVGLFFIAITLVFYAYKNYTKTQQLIAKGVKTKAKVINLIEVRSDDGYTYKPVFEYTNKLDKVITFESSYSAKPAPYAIGDMVQIIYSKTNTDRKVISFWGLYRWVVILLCIASPMLIIVGGYIYYRFS